MESQTVRSERTLSTFQEINKQYKLNSILCSGQSMSLVRPYELPCVIPKFGRDDIRHDDCGEAFCGETLLTQFQDLDVNNPMRHGQS
jgi:hypothetical protein